MMYRNDGTSGPVLITLPFGHQFADYKPAEIRCEVEGVWIIRVGDRDTTVRFSDFSPVKFGCGEYFAWNERHGA